MHDCDIVRRNFELSVERIRSKTTYQRGCRLAEGLKESVVAEIYDGRWEEQTIMDQINELVKI
jgi:hypothetical protein